MIHSSNTSSKISKFLGVFKNLWFDRKIKKAIEQKDDQTLSTQLDRFFSSSNASAQSYYGRIYLDQALERKDLKILKTVLPYCKNQINSIPIDPHVSESLTPLEKALTLDDEEGGIERIKALLDFGAEPHRMNVQGKSPLFLMMIGHYQVKPHNNSSLNARFDLMQQYLPYLEPSPQETHYDATWRFSPTLHCYLTGDLDRAKLLTSLGYPLSIEDHKKAILFLEKYHLRDDIFPLQLEGFFNFIEMCDASYLVTLKNDVEKSGFFQAAEHDFQILSQSLSAIEARMILVEKSQLSSTIAVKPVQGEDSLDVKARPSQKHKI